VEASASASSEGADASSSDAGAPEELRAPDGGASACRVLYGPVQLPVKSAVALVPRLEAVDAVMNDNGRPRVVGFAAPSFAAHAPPAVREVVDGASMGLSVPCALAEGRAFCPDRSGGIHASDAAGGGEHVVASSRSGTRVAAGVVGQHHIALAYLATRQTSEGWVTEAWLAIDDAPPVRFSEDGSGATAVALAPRGAGLMALMVDARAALTAMHARSVTYEHDLRVGEDSVVFVGGPGDRRTAPAFALPASGPAWGLLPIAKDLGDFGLATVKLEDPPKVDEPVTWSMYANGLDPAPVAAAIVRGRTWVALVRPRTPSPSSPRVLELGEITAHGEFASYEIVPTGAMPNDVSLATDDHGALWLAWVDGPGAWVERLACR
jgi:hypothetical protein